MYVPSYLHDIQTQHGVCLRLGIPRRLVPPPHRQLCRRIRLHHPAVPPPTGDGRKMARGGFCLRQHLFRRVLTFVDRHTRSLARPRTSLCPHILPKSCSRRSPCRLRIQTSLSFPPVHSCSRMLPSQIPPPWRASSCPVRASCCSNPSVLRKCYSRSSRTRRWPPTILQSSQSRRKAHLHNHKMRAPYPQIRRCAEKAEPPQDGLRASKITFRCLIGFIRNI